MAGPKRSNAHRHDLRHTAATLLLTQGINPKVVSEMLGHVSVELTLDQNRRQLKYARWWGYGSHDGTLFALRGLPSRGLTLDRLSELGFAVLERRPPTLIVLGLVARPWRLDGGLHPTDAAHFDAFAEPGYVRIAWSFVLAPVRDGSATLLVTETRVAATDAHARRRFGRYWSVVGPFSGLVRRMMLAAVARGSVHGADRTC